MGNTWSYNTFPTDEKTNIKKDNRWCSALRFFITVFVSVVISVFMMNITCNNMKVDEVKSPMKDNIYFKKQVKILEEGGRKTTSSNVQNCSRDLNTNQLKIKTLVQQ